MSEAPLKPTFRARLHWDASQGAVFDEVRRYMLIKPEALMGIFRRLPQPARLDALAALEASIFEQGGESARAYKAMNPQADGAGLIRLVAATAPELGWGLWSVEITGDLVRVTVTNSPFAAGYGKADHLVCHAIKGMVRATSSLALGRPTMVEEVACAAMGAPACVFEARPQS